MKQTTKEAIMRMVAKRVLKYPDIYESYNSGILVMSRFYITAARILEKNGVESVLYLAEFERGMGMYLHGKKYGVTPELYASRLIEKVPGRISKSVKDCLFLD